MFTQAKYVVSNITQAAPLRKLAYACVMLPMKNPGYTISIFGFFALIASVRLAPTVKIKLINSK
jgi:hypothetical protein